MKRHYTESTAFQQAMFADPRQAFTPHELLNTDTVLLGLVVEKVSGQPLHSYVQDHIVTPLGMSHTSFPTTNAFPEPHPQGYTVQTADGKEAAATDWNPSWGWAAGAMISPSVPARSRCARSVRLPPPQQMTPTSSAAGRATGSASPAPRVTATGPRRWW